MSISLAPVTQYLLVDNFYNDPNGPVSPITWSYPTGAAEYIPSPVPGGAGTETEPYLPSVENGALQLTLQTYNPTSYPPGTSFLGSAIFSNQTFNDNVPGMGVAFTAVAKLATTVPGMDGGIFAYSLNSPTSHNEIDSESLTDYAASQNPKELTNIYSNEPPNTEGHPEFVPDPSLTTYQTYTMEWFPNAVLWFIDGVLVRDSTVDVPQGSMQFYLNLWAYDAGYSGAPLQPTAIPQDNATYTFDVQAVSVAAIENNTDNTVTDMFLHNNNGAFAIWDIGDNALLFNGLLNGSAGSEWQVAGLGAFDGSGTTDMLFRNTNTNQLAIWDISNNQLTNTPPAFTGPGSGWQIAGLGDFSGNLNETDILWQDGNTYAFWDISNNQLTNTPPAFTGPGPGWQIAGVGDFSGNADETDMLFRNTNTNQLAIWDISNNRLTNTPPTFTGPGSGWQIAGLGDFSGNPNETDILWQDGNTYAVWDISNNQVNNTPPAFTGPGSGWQTAGFGDFGGYINETDILWRNNTTNQFAIWDINNNQVTGTPPSIGGAGSEWHVAGIADPPTPSSVASTAQLVQAMGSFGASGAINAPGAVLAGADASQQTLLTMLQQT